MPSDIKSPKLRNDAAKQTGAMMTIEPLKLSLHQVAEMTGECLPLLHDAINLGHLDTFLVGRRRFARPAAVRSWVDFLEAQSKAGKPVVYRGRVTERGATI